MLDGRVGNKSDLFNLKKIYIYIFLLKTDFFFLIKIVFFFIIIDFSFLSILSLSYSYFTRYTTVHTFFPCIMFNP